MNINKCFFGNMIWVEFLVKQVIEFLKIMTLQLKNKNKKKKTHICIMGGECHRY